MTGRRNTSIVLTFLGFLSMLVGAIAIYTGLHGLPVVLREPEKARQCAEMFLKAVHDGSLTEAVGFLSDPSSLGEVPADADGVAALVWDTYRTRLEAKATSGLYPTADGLAMDVELTAMDVDAAVEEIGDHAVALMQEHIASASDMSELYGDDGQYRQELVDGLLLQAALETLMRDLPTKTTGLTLHLARSGEGWRVIPDQVLIDALSGRS